MPAPARAAVTLWLWTTDQVRTAVSSGDLSAILRAYRTATGISQRRLAEELGYDSTYISMIENGRRHITDIAARRRIAKYLGIPARTLGVVEPSNTDLETVLQFAESTIRLAMVARQAGHGTAAINELWPLLTTLEARLSAGEIDPDLLALLVRARAEFGVCLGYALPEERQFHAARWTGRALRLADRLADRDLLAFALRVHGNELRKVGRPAAAVARLRQAASLAAADDQAVLHLQLARAVGELGAASHFDEVMRRARRLGGSADTAHRPSEYALYEVRLRGLAHTGRMAAAGALLDDQPASSAGTPPQWEAMLHVTIGEVLLAQADGAGAESAFTFGIDAAERHRLPQQIQRAANAARHHRHPVSELGEAALDRLLAPPQVSAV